MLQLGSIVPLGKATAPSTTQTSFGKGYRELTLALERSGCCLAGCAGVSGVLLLVLVVLIPNNSDAVEIW